MLVEQNNPTEFDDISIIYNVVRPEHVFRVLGETKNSRDELLLTLTHQDAAVRAERVNTSYKWHLQVAHDDFMKQGSLDYLERCQYYLREYPDCRTTSDLYLGDKREELLERHLPKLAGYMRPNSGVLITRFPDFWVEPWWKKTKQQKRFLKQNKPLPYWVMNQTMNTYWHTINTNHDQRLRYTRFNEPGDHNGLYYYIFEVGLRE